MRKLATHLRIRHMLRLTHTTTKRAYSDVALFPAGAIIPKTVTLCGNADVKKTSLEINTWYKSRLWFTPSLFLLQSDTEPSSLSLSLSTLPFSLSTGGGADLERSSRDKEEGELILVDGVPLLPSPKY
jgi:hypothetical protein